MKNLTNPTWIMVKGCLFLLLGMLAGVLQFLEHPTLRAGLLLIVAVWAFCRFYYFVFYVIEGYVDASYRFSGFLPLARWLIQHRKATIPTVPQSPSGSR